jgi:biopolymer transport protein ExbD
MRGLNPATMVLALAALLGASVGCEGDPKKNPFEPPPKETKEPPPLATPPKPSGPPDLSIDNLGPKVGYARIIVDRSDTKLKLEEAIGEHKQHFDGKQVTLRVDRKAKPDWVVLVVDELAKVGATKILMKTESRAEFPAELVFTPQDKLGQVESCTVVAMILTDRGTAVWKVAGGTASKRPKGFAGPDLSTTSETLERYSKACKDSKRLLVSGAEGVEWGLVYDLAASGKKLEDAAFEEFVLLEERPVAGRKVELSG